MTLSVQTVGWLGLGLITGIGSVWLIQLAVDRYLRSLESGKRPFLLPGLLARIAVTTGLLFLAARTGLINGVVALMGYWLGRTILLRGISRRVRDSPPASVNPRSTEQEGADPSPVGPSER